MDRPFILKMCESYYNDFDLNKTGIWKNREDGVAELSSEIFSIIENLKLEDSELYTELFTFSRQKQYNVIYNLLDEYIKEEFSDEVLEPTGINSDLEVVEEAVTPLYLLATAVAAGVGFNKITKATINSVVALGKINKVISSYINRLTTSFRVNKAILFADDDACLKKCGIKSQSDLSRLVVLHRVTGVAVGEQAQQDSTCLRNCFFDLSLDIVETLAKAYRQCLEASGVDTRNLNSITTILGHTLSEQCKTFHDHLLSHKSDFDDAVKHIVIDPSQRSVFTSQYEKRLIQGLKGGGSSVGFKQNKPFQPKKRY